MSKEKQIEEMAKDIEDTCENKGCNEYRDCSKCRAEWLYELGYRKQSEWISVDERLPEKGIDYLCRCIVKDNTDYPFYMVLRYILIDENPHFQHECENGIKVTHWMLIPEAPKMKGGAE